jgi:CubicO group peptidase (beta-lactamase class C family)
MGPLQLLIVWISCLAFVSAQTSCDTLPQNEYSRTSPSNVGIDEVKLQQALAYAAVQGSSSIKVFRNGCLVGQGLRDAVQDRVPELNAGQTKAIIALVGGILADRGWVDLDAPIDEYVEPGLGDAAHRSRTLRNFMNLVGGQQVNHVNGLNLFLDISRTREYFTTNLLHDAGTYYEFDEITPSVVVYCLERVIQAHEGGDVDFQAFTQRELFNKLGIPESAYFWQKDRSGVTTGYSGLWLRPLEYGRIGLLLLNNGIFGGRRILSQSFVQSMREGTSANCGFGLYVWLNSCTPGQSQVNTDYLK